MTENASGSDKKGRGRRAVALAGGSRDGTPKVVASGYGEIAERIIESAREHGVFVHDAPELMSLLMRLNLDEEIPPKLYSAIAEILIWARDLQAEKSEKPTIE